VRFLGARGHLLWRVRWTEPSPPPRRSGRRPKRRPTRVGRQCQDIGSGDAEKANDLLVARRQTTQGMDWSEETSMALMRLRALRLNGDWDRYWRQRTFPSLLVA